MLKKLLLLNGLATILAVSHHAINWVLTGMFWWADQYLPVTVPYLAEVGGVSFFVLRVIDQLSVAGVPAFLFVSGYFIAIATGKQASLPWKIVFGRIKKLIPPYLIWSIIIILINALLLNNQAQPYSILEIARLLLTGGAAAPYYYVPLIIQLFLLSPFLVPLARNHWRLLLLVGVLLQIPVTVAYYQPFVSTPADGATLFYKIFRDWHLPNYMLWFTLGMVASFHLSSFKALLDRHRRKLYTAALLTFVLGIIEWEFLRQLSGKEWISPQVTLVDKVYVFFVLLSFLALSRLDLPFSSQINQISSHSYGIYLTHVIVLEMTATSVYHLVPRLLAYPFLFYAVLLVLGLAIPLVMIIVTTKTFTRRNYSEIIFG